MVQTGTRRPLSLLSPVNIPLGRLLLAGLCLCLWRFPEPGLVIAAVLLAFGCQDFLPRFSTCLAALPATLRGLAACLAPLLATLKGIGRLPRPKACHPLASGPRLLPACPCRLGPVPCPSSRLAPCLAPTLALRPVFVPGQRPSPCLSPATLSPCPRPSTGLSALCPCPRPSSCRHVGTGRHDRDHAHCLEGLLGTCRHNRCLSRRQPTHPNLALPTQRATPAAAPCCTSWSLDKPILGPLGLQMGFANMQA